MVNVTIRLTTQEYAAIAALLEVDYPYETTVEQYLESCARDLASEGAAQ